MKQVDVLVAGGGLGGCLAALTAAKSGKNVVLCELSETLGKEIGGFMQTYLPKELVSHDSPLYDLGAINEDDINCADACDKEVPIFSGAQRSSMLRRLLKAGVKVLYMAYPVAVATKNDRVCGLVLATKYGSYLLKAGSVIDTTGVVSALCNGNTVELATEVTVSYAFECDRVLPENEGLTLPLSLGSFPELGIQRAQIHKGKRTEDTVLVDFSFSDCKGGSSAERAGRLHAEAHQKTMELCATLKETYSWFSRFQLLSPGNDVSISGMEHTSCVIKGIHSPSITLPWGFTTDQLLTYSNDITATAKAATLDCKKTEPDTLLTVGSSLNLSDCNSGTYLDDPILELSLLKIDLSKLQSVTTAEIAVVGGGVGGSAAAMGTVGSERDVLITEAKGMLGGTRTLGLVTAFWHGYQGGFALQNRQNVKQFTEHYVGDNFIHPAYAEAFYHAASLLKDGKRFLFNSLIFDVIKEANKVKSFLVATEYGPLKIDCDVLIDATGDGDAAFFAGAEYTYADERDGVTQGYSIWGMEAPNTKWLDSRYRGDPDSLCAEYYSDLLRGIYKGQLQNSPYGYSSLMTVRETRHIKGLYTLNLKDIVLGTTFHDTLAVSMCLYDAHGVGSCPLYYTYLFDPILPFPNQEDVKIRIPYRCILPEGIEGLLVVAKAISASRDAACLIRMNADIQNLGFAAGLMATEAVKLNILPSKADPKSIQPKLEELEILPQWWDKKAQESTEEIIEKAMDGDKNAMLCAVANNTLFTAVQKAFDITTDTEKKRNLGLVLACHYDDRGTDLLISHLSELTLGLKENPRNGMRAIMTYLTVLSWAFHDNIELRGKLLPAFAEFLEAAQAGGEFINPDKGIYQNSKVSNRTVPNFKALLAVASAAEILADPILQKPLERLIVKKNIYCGENRDVHVVQLYLRLAAAAARCGSRVGVSILIQNLDDDRIFFKNFIKNELAELSGEDKAYSSDEWNKVFALMPEIPIKPTLPQKKLM